MKKKKSDYDLIRITGVPKEVKEKIENIAANKGTSVSKILRPKLREVINENENKKG